MKKYLFLFILPILFHTNLKSIHPLVRTGIDVLRNNNFDVLKNKKIGLITNATGVDSNLKSTIDILHANKSCKLIALFCPEHGIRGDKIAGEYIESYRDPITKLRVFSLHGKTRKPTRLMLKNIDTLVYDIQDIGCRSYTYISTMGLAMQAAAENNIDFVILDRPNPLGGKKIEGPIIKEKYLSFIGKFKIPYIYGLTCGELATLLNSENMLGVSKKCKLKVVRMQNWKRTMGFTDTCLPWIPTSPHIPNKDSAFYYPASGIVGELQVISTGIGYTLPFQTFAAEWINEQELAKHMNALNLYGVKFSPVCYKPFYGQSKNKEFHGVQIHLTDPKRANLMDIQFHFIKVHNKLYPKKDLFKLATRSRISMFDKAVGTSKIRKALTNNISVNNIKQKFEKDITYFKRLSRKHYLYR